MGSNLCGGHSPAPPGHQPAEPVRPEPPKKQRSTIRTIPEPLFAHARDRYATSTPSVEQLTQSAFSVGGLPAYGLLGTTRMLRSQATREHHAKYSVDVLRENIDDFLLGAGKINFGNPLSPAQVDRLERFMELYSEDMSLSEILSLGSGEGRIFCSPGLCEDIRYLEDRCSSVTPYLRLAFVASLVERLQVLVTYPVR